MLTVVNHSFIAEPLLLLFHLQLPHKPQVLIISHISRLTLSHLSHHLLTLTDFATYKLHSNELSHHDLLWLLQWSSVPSELVARTHRYWLEWAWRSPSGSCSLYWPLSSLCYSVRRGTNGKSKGMHVPVKYDRIKDLWDFLFYVMVKYIEKRYLVWHPVACSILRVFFSFKGKCLWTLQRVDKAWIGWTEIG